MDDVEFLGAGPESDGDDDVLTVGPQRRWPRWLVVLATVIVVAGGAAAFIAKADHSPHHTAQPSLRPAPPPSTAAPSPRGVDGISLGPGTLTLAIAGGQLFTLTPTRLASFEATTMRPIAAVSFGRPLRYTDRYFQITFDLGRGSIWLVPIGGRSPGTLMEFGLLDLRPLRSIPLSTTLASAAVLDGRLYLGTADHGLLGVPRNGRPISTVLRSPDGIGPLVADPDRRRLLYLTDGVPAQVRSWSPKGGAGAEEGRLDLAKADLVVVSGSIWATGYRTHGAAVVRLDPGTLRPVRSATALAAQLGPGAIIVAGGDRDFFVRSDSTADQLWCVDGRTGAIDQMWFEPAGPVAAAPGQVWVAGVTTPRSLVLRGCVG
jgi:hypothetical protein